MKGGVGKTDVVNRITPRRKWGTLVLCLGPIIVQSVVPARIRLWFSHASVFCTLFTAMPWPERGFDFHMHQHFVPFSPLYQDTRYPMMSGEDWNPEEIGGLLRA